MAALLGVLVEAVGSDRVDLVDLRRAGGLLRFRVARDGQVVYEPRPQLPDTFRFESYADAFRLLQKAGVLADAALTDRLVRAAGLIRQCACTIVFCRRSTNPLVQASARDGLLE